MKTEMAELNQESLMRKLGDECFFKMKEINPSGGIKEFIRIAVEFGYKKGQSHLKIKQLEWSEEQCSNEDIPYNHVKANSPLGTYTIEWKGWKDYDDKTIFLDGIFVSMGGLILDDAKILAQSDFERKVKECLITE